MSLKLVTQPLRIGPMEIRNRIVRTAHGTQLAKHGVSDDLIAFHRERAIGGCAMTILEAGSVHPTSIIDFALWDDAIVPRYRLLADAVHEHGMKIIQQIWHGGNIYRGAGGVAPWAVSDKAGYLGVVGIPMTRAQIEALKDAFVATALRCKAGGLDGVEIHAAHGYIFSQFLSSAYNDRTDEYGGSLENRARFLLETARAVRAAVGPDFVVGMRASASEAPNFLSGEEVRQAVEWVQDEGLIDYLSVSYGDYYLMDTMVGGTHRPAGYELPGAEPILSAGRVPRIVAGRFRSLDEAETVLREGHAEMVSMARAHIADAHLVRKTLEGRPEDVRPCIACNQGCGVNAGRVGRIGCTGNPVTGVEVNFTEGNIPKTSAPKRVLVVGGGPAGLEAARTASLVGHHVVLAEAAPKLGGQAYAASRAPTLHIFGDLLQWLETQVYQQGVEVRLGAYLTAEDVREIAPDAVIVATGAEARLDGYQLANPGEAVAGCDLPHVISAEDLMTARTPPAGASALVLDTTGGYAALAACEQLLNQGKAVTLVTHLDIPSPDGGKRSTVALDRFLGKDFTQLTRSYLAEIKPGECLVRPLHGTQLRAVKADVVVLITQNRPRRDLYDELAAEFPVTLVGDALLPRDMQYAIRDGHFAARELA